MSAQERRERRREQNSLPKPQGTLVDTGHWGSGAGCCPDTQ